MIYLQSLQQLLEASTFEDYWSDEGILYAQELLLRLSGNDWHELLCIWQLKNRLWKISLASALNGITHPGAIECLRQLLADNDEDVFYEAAVSLEESLRAGAKASEYFLEFQNNIERMKRQQNKDLLGVYSLEKLLQDQLNHSHPEVNP